MSDPDALQAILLDLQHQCTDVATILSGVATCPERLSRLWPAVVRELRVMRRTIDVATPLIEAAVAGDEP
jgi:hypothetical protein